MNGQRSSSSVSYTHLDVYKRQIIEPSGVGKLSDVIAAVENVAEEAELTLENFITVADGTKCKMYIKNFGEFYNNQIELSLIHI